MGFGIHKNKKVIKTINVSTTREPASVQNTIVHNEDNSESPTSAVVKKGRATSYSASSVVIYPKKKPIKQHYKPSTNTPIKQSVPVEKTPIPIPDNLESSILPSEVVRNDISSYSAPSLIMYPKKKPVNKITVGTMNSSTLRKNKTVINIEPEHYTQTTKHINKEIFIAEYTKTINIKQQNSGMAIVEAPYKKGNASTIVIPEFEIIFVNN